MNPPVQRTKILKIKISETCCLCQRSWHGRGRRCAGWFFVLLVFTFFSNVMCLHMHNPISQCLALNTVHESRIVPPQNCIPPYKIATCHGIMLGAGSPPTTRKEFFIKSGIEAEMVKGYSIIRQINFQLQ